MRILIVEDEAKTAAFLTQGLSENGFAVDVARRGDEGLARVREGGYDLVILDVMLPKLDGWSVLTAIRQEGTPTPVLFLTARDGLHDKIAGFEAGGDDYLTKPFELDEVRVRLDALLRRTPAPAAAEPGGAVLDPARHALVVGEAEVSLTPTEFRLLGRLMADPSTVVRRHALVAAAWPHGAMVSDNTLDSYVRRIRKKLEPLDLAAISTVRGVGYRWR